MPPKTAGPRLKTVTVSLANRPGALAAAARALADAKINVEGVEAEILGTHGFFRFHTREAERATRLLAQKGFIVNTSDVVGVVIADRPGELARVCETLADAKINVESCFGSGSPGGTTIRIFLRVSDTDAAYEVLRKHGIEATVLQA